MDKPYDVDGLFQRATSLLLKLYPETASSAGLDKGKYSALKSQLTDRSLEGQQNIKSEVTAMAKELDFVRNSPIDLVPEWDTTLDVTLEMFNTAVEGFDIPYGDMALLNYNWSYRPSPYVVAQNTGAFIEIPSFLDASHSLESGDDAQSYLTRMSAYAGQLDGETERVRLYGEAGVILPDFLLAKTVGQLKAARAQDVSDWGIVKTLASKFEGESAKAVEIAKSEIGPAIDRQIAALEALAPRATSDAGVWAQPNGEAYYDWAIKAGTTTAMSADEVHDMGLSELSDLHARMDPILKSVGYDTGSVGARMQALAKDKRYHFADGDKGRAEIMSFIEATVADIRTRMPDAFETLVPGFLEVTRISPDVEAGAPGAYGGAGSIDGTKPGHFWINLRDPAMHNKFTLPDLTYHEAIPGHVWQGEYTFKQPLIRSLLAFNAYSEGWALYAQQIADEMGVYDDFAVGRLGYLQSLAFRACRLVVDTGLHSKRWSREKANEWFVTANGSNAQEVAGEVDRYCAWPGQALGYKIGHSEINSLRARAQKELGERYDYKRFNDALVLGGAVPMTVLGRVIDGYIAREKQA
jgi:uncharacterized protein (DUF885 family)